MMAIESTHERYYRLKREFASTRDKRDARFDNLRSAWDRIHRPTDEDLMFWGDVQYGQLNDEFRRIERELAYAKRDLKIVLNAKPEWIVA